MSPSSSSKAPAPLPKPRPLGNAAIFLGNPIVFTLVVTYLFLGAIKLSGITD